MKPINLAVLLALAVGLVIACKKDKTVDYNVENGKLLAPTKENIQGTWHLIATKLSPGGAITEWKEDKSGKSITWSASSFKDEDGNQRAYILSAADTTAPVKLYTVGSTDTGYAYITVYENVLYLSGRCIEECSYKFVR